MNTLTIYLLGILTGMIVSYLVMGILVAGWGTWLDFQIKKIEKQKGGETLTWRKYLSEDDISTSLLYLLFTALLWWTSWYRGAVIKMRNSLEESCQA
ncbi:MAG TPA: hypothetical protein VJI33_04995 [Candidatus Paceibacterota bacterium]